jgi:rhodanese-related sulfurtransferase
MAASHRCFHFESIWPLKNEFFCGCEETTSELAASKQLEQICVTPPYFEKMSAAELVRRSGSGELWLVLDVREPWEVNIARIAGAKEIPMAQIPERAGELDLANPVAVLCHTGVRSARVAAWLVQNGFGTVANIEGGIDAWSVQIDETIPRY